MEEFQDNIEPTDVPQEFEVIQHILDRFVKVNYNAALGAVGYNNHDTAAYLSHCKAQSIDIIRNNPPLRSVPIYFRDGRADYLWYSDFYDDIAKDALRKYQAFRDSVVEVTPANYAEELTKIDLPYFKELVNLVSLERLCMDYEVKEVEPEIESTPEAEVEPDSTPILEPSSETPKVEEVLLADKKQSTKPKPTKVKRSYEPKLNEKQYTVLADCLETIRLFRQTATIGRLKKLLNGRMPGELQVTNQKTLVYLFDELSKIGCIKSTWTSVAGSNEDFRSFSRGKNIDRFGSEGKILTADRINRLRKSSKIESVHGLIAIDEMFEKMAECK